MITPEVTDFAPPPFAHIGRDPALLERLLQPDLLGHVIPIAPPGAFIQDGKPLEAAGKRPAIGTGDGFYRPVQAWQSRQFTEASLRAHADGGGSLGLRGYDPANEFPDEDALVFVDIDVLDPALAKLAHDLAIEMLGATATRYSSGKAKCALIYRGAFRRLAITFEVPGSPGEKQPIEVLSENRQIVAWGGHANGTDLYRWDQTPPSPRDLPEINPDSVWRYFDELEKRARAELGATLKRRDTGVRDPLTPSQLAELEAYESSDAARNLVAIVAQKHDRTGIKADLRCVMTMYTCVKDIEEGIYINPNCYSLGLAAAIEGLSKPEAIDLCLEALKSAKNTREHSEWLDRCQKAPGAVGRGWEAGMREWGRSAAADFCVTTAMDTLYGDGNCPDDEFEAQRSGWEVTSDWVRGQNETKRQRAEAKRKAAAAAQPLLFHPIFDVDAPRVHTPWTYKGYHARGVLSSLVGTGGTFKSSLAIAEAVCMATGKPVLGVPIKRPLRVHIHSAEDPINLVVDRANAFLKQHGLTGAELGDRLTVSSNLQHPFLIAHQSGDKGIVINEVALTSFKSAMIEGKVDHLLLDPFGKLHSVGENDNTAINQITSALTKLADEGCMSIELAHHSTKMAGRQVTAENSRGASALHDAVRSSRVINVLEAAEGAKYGIAPGDCWRYLWVDHGKANLGPRNPRKGIKIETVFFRGIDPETGDNAEDVSFGAATVWDPQVQRPELPKELIVAVQLVLQRWSHDPFVKANRSNSNRWIGNVLYAVLEAAEQPENQRTDAAVAAQIETLICAGHLRAERRPGVHNRHVADCLVAGERPAFDDDELRPTQTWDADTIAKRALSALEAQLQRPKAEHPAKPRKRAGS